MIDPAFFILWKNQLKRGRSVLRHHNWAQVLVIFVTLSIFVGFGFGIFFFSLSSFQFLNQYSQTGTAIITYSLAVTFLLTCLLVFSSSFIAGFGLLFQKEDNSLLFSLPINTETIFESRMIETTFFSLWPLFLLALPLIASYSLTFHLTLFPTLFFLLGLLYLALFFNQLGIIGSILVSRLLGNLKNKFFGPLLLLATPFIALVFLKLILPSPLISSKLELLPLEEVNQLLEKQPLLHPFLPTTWLTRGIIIWPKTPQTSLLYFYLIICAYLVTLLITLLLRKKFYRAAVDKTALGRFLASPLDRIHKKSHPFPYLLPGWTGALTEKDWLLVFRSPNQLFQIAFLFFLEIIFLLVVKNIPILKIKEIFPFWYQERLLKVSFLFLNYLMAVFAMRFFFPLFSLESHSRWIIWTAPFAKIKIFYQKLVSSFLILLIWSTISNTVLLNTLGFSVLQKWPLLLVNIPLCLTLCIITVGIGAIKPNFWEKNPEKLSTTPAGILATGLCLGYLSLVVLLLSLSKDSTLFSASTHFFIWTISFLVSEPIFNRVLNSIDKNE